MVTLTATTRSGYDFSHWSEDARGSSTTTTATVNGNQSVTADFVEKEAPTAGLDQESSSETENPS